MTASAETAVAPAATADARLVDEDTAQTRPAAPRALPSALPRDTGSRLYIGAPPEFPESGSVAGHRAPGRRAAQAAWGAAGIAATVAVLEAASRLGLVSRRFLPPVSEIVPEAVRLLGRERFWTDVRATLMGWAIAFAIAVAGGVVLGFLLGIHPAVRRLTASTIDFLRPIPSVAFIPVVVLLFGTTLQSKVVLAVYASLWPVLLQTIAAVREVDPRLRDTARTLRMGPLAVLRHVIWPSSVPFILTGVRLSASVALVLCIASELIIGNPGLGKDVGLAKDGAAFTRMYALILVVGLIGVLINLALAAAGRAFLRRHPPHVAGRLPS